MLLDHRDSESKLRQQQKVHDDKVKQLESEIDELRNSESMSQRIKQKDLELELQKTQSEQAAAMEQLKTEHIAALQQMKESYEKNLKEQDKKRQVEN